MKICPTCGRPIKMHSFASRYEADVAGAIRTIKERGRIWESARVAFENDSYYDAGLARMLAEGVIVPASEPDKGYVLPTVISSPSSSPTE